MSAVTQPVERPLWGEPEYFWLVPILFLMVVILVAVEVVEEIWIRVRYGKQAWEEYVSYQRCLEDGDGDY